MDFKDFYLMHKDIAVCSFEISDIGEIKRIRRIKENEKHFPLGGLLNDSKFHDWWKDRAIPNSRHGIKNALNKLGYSSTGNALIDNLGLSLTDCYWIKPRDLNLKWNDVNLFKNDFFDLIGEISFKGYLDPKDLKNKTNFSIASSQGELKKKWCISKDKRRYLIKGNYGLSYQQSLNEVFASNIIKHLGFDNFVEYKLIKINNNGNEEIGCYSYNFCNNNIEMISAWDLIQTAKIKPGSYYYLLKDACLKYGMDEEYFDSFMDFMIMFDYLITNTDRHMNNIGILRNSDTLEIIGFAPIYDCGNSMFYNLDLDSLKKLDINKIKTPNAFIVNEIELLKYVKNRNTLKLNKLKYDFAIYKKDKMVISERYAYIEKYFKEKINNIKRFQNGEDIFKRNYKK